MKIDKDVVKQEKKSNFKERIWFIKYWVNYMKSHSVEEWSKQQADFIDAQFKD
jgi:hypothetical protein